MMIQARQIHFFGLGASAPVAMDAQHKFFRFNLAVSAHPDVLMQRMLASVAHTGDLFVIISYTGRTRELVEVARQARENGASVLGITAAGSPLASACSLSLHLPLPEDTDIYMPMTSRIIQLTVLDVLATGMTLRRGSDFQPHLRKIKESLNASRYPAEDNIAGMPDHGVVAVAGVDVQLALPGRVVQLHLRRARIHLLAAPVEGQRAFFAAGLAVEPVIAVDVLKTRRPQDPTRRPAIRR